MTNDTTLQLIISAKDEATEKLNGFGKTLGGMSSSLKQVGIVSTAIFAGISAEATFAMKAYAEAEQQTAITNQSLTNSFNQLSGSVLKGVQQQLGVTTGGLEKLKDMANKTGESALRLAFDDEEASRSFAKLFAVTKDTTEAQKEVALAMDLARYKGISLEDATQKLMLVHAGSTKELKQLGIAVTDGATVMENLNSITKQVTGSAEAYLKTTAGATEALKVQMGQLQEMIGQQLAPVLISLLTTITPIVMTITNWISKHPTLTKYIILTAGAVTGLIAGLYAMSLAVGVLTAISSPWLLIIGAIILAIGALIAITILCVNKWDTIKVFFKTLWEDIKNIFKEGIDFIMGYVNSLMSMIDNLISKAKSIGSSIGNVGTTVMSAVNSPIQTVVNAITGKRANGGNVAQGSSYLVGENGAEMFTPTSSGFITPTNKLSSGGQNIVVNITGTFLSEDAGRRVGDMIISRFKTMNKLAI